METARILGLEWHRWLFFLFAWLPWLLVEVWYYLRMKKRFRENPDDPVAGEESSTDEL